jgi:octaprenyl-diphosphate synthase
VGVQDLSTLTFLATAAEKLNSPVLQRIAAEIALVEEVLEREVGSEIQLVSEVGRHTLRAGGKRLRPALVTLAAIATGENFDPSRTRRLGACMELIHMATLVHDDVVDRADTRRGVQTAAAVFGNTASILAGDALLAKAMAILAEDGDLEIIRNVSRAVVRLAEGEVRELEVRGNLRLTEQEHFEILDRKTASLIQSCCEVGALAACAPDSTVQALGRYGFHLGLAFQISDDLLDYRGLSDRIGKPRATDFREGCVTLPLLFLMPTLTEQEREFAQHRFGNGASDEDVLLLCELMEKRGAFEKAERLARAHGQDAMRAIEAVPEGEGRDLLHAVAVGLASREA